MLTISTVASQLGVSPDVLRKWESRHGWPAPLRSEGGTRLYDQTQLAQLRRAKRIIESGYPVGQALTIASTNAPLPNDPVQAPQDLARLLELIAHGEFAQLRDDLLSLRSALDGIAFIESCAAPLMQQIGDRWASGHIRVWQEHAASAVMREALHLPTGLEVADPEAGQPLALLTTPPGERHTLGLSMARLILRRLGAACIELGGETPLDELAAAAHASGADIVGLSVSRGFAPRALHTYAEALRDALPAQCALWLGGSGATRRGDDRDGIMICGDAQSIRRRLQACLARRAPPLALEATR